MEKYCGTYQEQNGDKECTVRILNGNLVCDLLWPDIRLIPSDKNEDYFNLESFPICIKFRKNQEGLIKEFSLSGREDLEDRVLYRV